MFFVILDTTKKHVILLNLCLDVQARCVIQPHLNAALKGFFYTGLTFFGQEARPVPVCFSLRVLI